jgi:hypothetical protein
MATSAANTGVNSGWQRQAGSLGFHDAPRKQPPPMNEVLSKRLGHDLLDIGDVHPIDDTCDHDGLA